MKRFLALQQFSTDRLVADAAITEECAHHRQPLFRIIRGLADTPFIPFTGITRNDLSRLAVESRDSFGIPPLGLGPGQHLRLLTNGVAAGQCLESADDALLKHRDSECFKSLLR